MYLNSTVHLNLHALTNRPLTDFAMYGANILPTLATAELEPIPAFRTTVGKISAE